MHQWEGDGRPPVPEASCHHSHTPAGRGAVLCPGPCLCIDGPGWRAGGMVSLPLRIQLRRPEWGV